MSTGSSYGLSVYFFYISDKIPLLRGEISALNPMEMMAKVGAYWRKLLEQEIERSFLISFNLLKAGAIFMAMSTAL